MTDGQGAEITRVSYMTMSSMLQAACVDQAATIN